MAARRITARFLREGANEALTERGEREREWKKSPLSKLRGGRHPVFCLRFLVSAAEEGERGNTLIWDALFLRQLP